MSTDDRLTATELRGLTTEQLVEKVLGLRDDLDELVAERDALHATMNDNAAVSALNAIASICGCPDWDYPGQLVRDVEALRTERDRLQRACDEGLPREVIPCPSCKVPHVEGPRHDDPTMDGRVRPHHTHRCYGCGHVWDDGRWTFGVAPGGENEVTKRLRAEGVRLALVAVQARNREAYEMHRKGADEVSGTLAAWTDEMVREIRDLLPEGKAATDEHNAAVLRARDEGRAAGLREALALVESYQRALALVDSYQPPSVPTEPTELDNVVSMIGTVLRATKGGGA